jgi:hypothetical protein
VISQSPMVSTPRYTNYASFVLSCPLGSERGWSRDNNGG